MGPPVLVFTSADSDYFISHLDMTRIDECRMETSRLTSDASLGLLFRHLSESRRAWRFRQCAGAGRGLPWRFLIFLEGARHPRRSAGSEPL